MNFDFVTDIFAWLAQLAVAAEPWQQGGVLLLAGAIPFIESYLGSFLGVLLGVPPVLAVAAAVLGNLASTFLVTAIAGGARGAVMRNRSEQQEPSPRRRKVAKYLDRLGVPGVCLLGPLVLASQITAPALVALGAKKRSVFLFQGLSIVVWGILFGFFGNAVIAWFL
ncbi:hypothetical protein [Gulosibacter sp. 10]|uniref:hypothetical protein n=1 Tax=Gulosibacter sp. 10 TaxID=1255570 RepID=UPI00097EEBBA|nr:hypothetical protein [Gulosibacter sp. 10]SJM58065.1 hypothetical protein FM112_05630 [Gulosibacter sp. 10]